MLTRSTLQQHATMPQLPPFSIDRADSWVRMVNLDTFWKELASSRAGFIGNSVGEKVQILVSYK